MKPTALSPMQPPMHPLLGHLPAFRTDPLGFLTHCAREYGSVVPLRMLHRSAFLLLDPADIERVLVSEHRNFIKPQWLQTSAVRRVLGEGLVNAEGEAWRQQRQLCQPAFQPRRMDGYAAQISRLAQCTLAEWQPGETRDLHQDMTHLALAVVAQTLFDVDAAGWPEEAGAAIETLMARFTAKRSLLGMIPLPASRAERESARRLSEVVDALIRRHAERTNAAPPDTKQTALLTLLRQPETGQKGNALHGQVKTFLSAGHESSALVLVWAFLLLARHPDAEEALGVELEAVLQGRPPEYADLPHLPFTQAIVQETLRLYPPVWMTGRQAIQPCEFGGFRVPGGAFVLTSQWAVQRMPRYFPCPDDFRPERWTNGETSGLPRFAYFPFGGGPRICIGQNFALVEAILLLASIAQRFRLEPVSHTEPQPWASMTLRPPSDLRMRLTARG